MDDADQRSWRRITELHEYRKFSPTDRQLELYDALLSAPCPPDDDSSGADRLTLLGYGGAMGGGKTRAIAELAMDAALAFPGNNVLVARHHLSDLSSTTMKEFLAHCPTGLILRRQQAPPSSSSSDCPTGPRARPRPSTSAISPTGRVSAPSSTGRC